MTYAAVGSIQASTGSPVPSLSLTTTTIGNFVLAEVVNTGTATATALASSNCTWSALGTPYTGVTTAGTCQCFLGQVTGTGAATVTISWGAGTTNVFSGLVAQEFSTTTGVPLLDKQGHIDTAGTSTWASLSPAAAGEAYFGYALNAGSATNGSTSGYTYGNDGSGNGVAQNAACGAGSTAPVWGDSGQQLGVMVLVGPAAQPARPTPPVTLYAPGWFPGSAAVTDDPGGIPWYPQPAPADATPANIIPATPEAAGIAEWLPLPPGWFPGADKVTGQPGSVPFAQQPPPITATPAVVFPVPEVAGEQQWLPWPPGYFPGSQAVSVDPGGIPFYSQPQPLTPPPAPPPAPFLTQILGTGTGKYLADQFGAPFLARGDALWALVSNAGYAGGSTTYQSDIDLYMSTRHAQGFNVALVDCITTTGEGLSNTRLNGNTWDGVAPFTGSIGTLNSAYWTRVDYAVKSASANGITLFLVLADKYSLGNAGAAMDGMTTGQATTYGAALAARYAAYPNIVWLFGNDYNDTNNSVYDAILAALRAGGDSHLVTIENLTEGDSRFSDLAGTSYTWGTANAQFNFVYSYGGNYPCLGYAYTEASPLAVLLGDGWYDGTGFGTIPAAERDFMRQQVWWTLSSGSRGYMYGDQSLISWNPHVRFTSPPPFAATDLNLIWNAFTSWAGWHLLVPDTGNVLVTANRGTSLGLFAANTAGSYTGQAGDLGGAPNYYVTASITADHSLAVLYLSDATGSHTGGAVTIDQTKLGSGYTATWVDPATGAQTSTTPGSTYTNVTANSRGGADWVLLLQGPPVGGASTATIAGAAAVTAKATQAVTASLAAAGAVTAVATVIAPATVAAAGTVAAVVTEAPIATAAGAGAVAAVVTEAAGASLAGSGAVTDVATEAVTAALAGAGSVTDVVTQTATASLAGAGAVNATATTPGGASTATIAGAGAVTDVVTQAVIASPAAAAAVTAATVQTATAALAGAGAVTAAVTEIAPATAAGAGVVTDVVTQIVTASPAGAGAVNANPASGGSTAAVAGAGAVTAAATQAATATAAGAGAVTASVTQAAKATLAGAGAVNASGQITGTANLAAAGAVTALAATAAPSTLAAAGTVTAAAGLRSTASLAAAGSVTATGISAASIINATSSPTVTDPRDGTSRVTATTTSTPAVTDA